MLAERSIAVPTQRLWLGVALMFALLYREFFWINAQGVPASDDCFLSLPLLCLLLFMAVGQTRWRKVKFDTKPLRYYSTIIYCSHASIACGLRAVNDHYGIEQGGGMYYAAMFMITLILSLLVSYVLLKLEKYKALRILRYAH